MTKRIGIVFRRDPDTKLIQRNEEMKMKSV